MPQKIPRRLVANENVVCADVEGEAVLLNIETGIYFGLDPVGTDIWRLLEQGTAEEEIVRRMQEEYDIESHQLEEDVRQFIAQLAAHGLISELSAS